MAPEPACLELAYPKLKSSERRDTKDRKAMLSKRKIATLLFFNP
jgi:hypothetical protein